jgi:hypothetical protein
MKLFAPWGHGIEWRGRIIFRRDGVVHSRCQASPNLRSFYFCHFRSATQRVCLYPSLSIPIHPFFCRLCWRMAQNLRIAQRHRVGSAGSAGYALLQTRRPGSPDSSDLCGSSWACPRCLGLRLHPVELGDSDRGLHGAWHGDRLRSSWISRPMCRRGHNENGDSLPI